MPSSSSSQQFQRVRDLFVELVELPQAERTAKLREVEKVDPELCRSVESLLAAERRAEDVFSVFASPLLSNEPSDISPLSEGETVGSYRILGETGLGGMGVVYLAEDVRLGRKVALKLLLAEATAHEEDLRRFEQEARAAARLNHPNICTIHHFDEHEGRPFLVMEYIEGTTLQERLCEGPLPVEAAVEYAIQIVEALSEAHTADIIHRDIKPGNIMVDAKGQVKVVDFGIAKLKGGGQHITQTGDVLGTIAYMAPEQIQGKEVDRRADLFSLGVVLYEMLTGRHPFPGEYRQAIAYQIINEEAEPPSTYQEELPPGLDEVVLRCLEKVPEDRYSSAAEVLSSLQEALPKPVAGSPSRAAVPEALRKPIPDNLPTPLTSFIGREEEVMEVGALLSRVRLLTLTGTAGTGKTRLGLEVARRMKEEFADGVSFVALAPVADPALVPSAIAQELGVRETGGISIRERLTRFLKDRRALLVLDNFEHVLEAAPFVSELLQSCPELKILVTSRQPLWVQGEHEYTVPPLSLPDAVSPSSPEMIKQHESIMLFEERARAIRPSFILTNDNTPDVAQICIRLDGLPLAIELAAVRSKVLPPAAILARLEHRLGLLTSGRRDAPDRHRTLREAIAWSYDLLAKDEKKLFQRLAVFAGGATIETAEALYRHLEVQDSDVLDGLTSLVDKNLLKQEEQPEGEPRFMMLETLREFGLECLVASGEEDIVRRAHLDVFLDLGEAARPHLTGAEQAQWLARLEKEHDNLRAALNFALKTDADSSAVRLGVAFWRFWLVRGYLSEGTRWLERLLALEDLTDEQRTRLLTGIGTLAHNQGQYEAARAYFEDSLELYRKQDDRAGVANTLNNLGWVAWRLGTYEQARALSEEALSIHRELDNKRGEGLALNNLAWVAHHQGDFSTAEQLHEENLALQRELKDKRGAAFALTGLGWATYRQGNTDEASAMLEEALTLFEEVGERQLFAFASGILAEAKYHQGDNEQALPHLEERSIPIFRDIGDRYGLAYALCIHGDVLYSQGDQEGAVSSYEESLQIRREIGDTWGVAMALHRLAKVAVEREEEARAASLLDESLTLRSQLDDKHGVAECLHGMARVAFQKDHLERAACLFAAADTLREQTGSFLPPDDRVVYERTASRLADALDRETLEATQERGRSMTLQEAVAHALR